MDERRKAVRRQLRQMAPSIAIPYIQSFLLPPEEEAVAIRHDCRGHSLQQIALELNLSIEAVKDRHARALGKIAGAEQNEQPPA